MNTGVIGSVGTSSYVHDLHCLSAKGSFTRRAFLLYIEENLYDSDMNRGIKKTAPKVAPKTTSWGAEAEWYSDHLEESDTYHTKVIMPNIERIVAPQKGLRVLEIGCGEGFIARTLAKAGAQVTACDISPELIKLGKEKGGGITYRVSKAEELDWVKPGSFDVVLAVLTLQNMERVEEVFKGVAGALSEKGRFIFVLNHPAFRIPKASSWALDQKNNVQYRRTDAYLSARKETIDMHPGKKGSKSVTYSFHRSLQDYMKALHGAALAIVRLEEWISHRVSQPGPHQKAENTARKEFPLFLMVECRRLG